MNYERSFEKEDLAAFKIGVTDCAECDTIAPFLIGGTRKGGGSAYGGEWKPSKPADERFWGTPGEIKTYFKPDGTNYETKIGPDGRAIRERHHTEHYPNGKHSNPHDHIINWETPRYGQVNFGPAINYWSGEIPEFKNYGLKGDCMKTVIYDTSTPEENKFKTIRDFKDCIIRGGEVVIRWKNEQLFIFKDSDGFCLVGTNVNGNIHRNTTDEVLEYVIGDDRLRDVITQVTVLDRTI